MFGKLSSIVGWVIVEGIGRFRFGNAIDFIPDFMDVNMYIYAL